VSIVENTITLLNAGSVTLEASQGGTTNYNPAEIKTQTFCVNPAKPAISMNNNSETVTLTSSSNEGNQWYVNTTAISNANSKTLEVTSPGTYSVKVTIDNCSSTLSDNQVIVITGAENIYKNKDLKIYPNPAVRELVLDFTDFDESTEITVSVLDMLGKPKTTLQVSGGTREYLNIETYAQGRYILKTTIGQQILYYKFVKQ
jgi:archaellum component FlaG (FlaF/FlaG flagellin family)